MKIFTANTSKLILFLFLIGINSAAYSDIYMFTDKQGQQFFTDKKVNKHYKLLLRSNNNRVASSFKNSQVKRYSHLLNPSHSHSSWQRIYHPLIIEASAKYQLDSALIHAMITVESNYQQHAISSAGAKGLMQLMPGTAKRFSVTNIFDPQQNIFAGALYLKILLEEFKVIEIALAAYNAGEGTVRRYKRQIPPYPETQEYVSKVLTFYEYYQRNLSI